jgi:hypothetical protein
MGPLSLDLPTVEVTSRAEWRDWLTQHHHQTTGVWVVTRKKGAVRTDGVCVSAHDIQRGMSVLRVDRLEAGHRLEAGQDRPRADGVAVHAAQGA